MSIPRPILLDLFAGAFQIERLLEGSTEVAEDRRASAWIYFRRLS